MKQVMQNLKTGTIELVDVPAPVCRPGQILIGTRRSLISAGTERMLVEFGQANLLAKARSQPERVVQVWNKIRTDGLLPTLEAVFSRLDQPLALGYCNAGIIQEVGEGVTGFSIGQRVVSNGPHAELVCMPTNLCAHIPDGVSDDEAAFTVLAAVGLQGIRLVNPTLGECVVIIGMGLIGLMTAQMLVANGCRVMGIDLDERKLALARTYGIETANISAGVDPVAAGMAFSGGRGVDAVIITASTKSSDPVHQAAQMSRKRGRIILVGVTGLELSRADFYEKELSFQVSCSYGPGRYDDKYEQGGQDYPIGFVRWTEQRNFEAVLGLMESGKVDIKPLISRQVSHQQAAEAYRLLIEDHTLLGVLLTYPETGVDQRRAMPSSSVIQVSPSSAQTPVVGVIGAGNFASMVLIPALKKTSAVLKTIAGGNDTTAAVAARRFGIQQATSDYHILLEDPQINTVFIATRHNLHARLVVEALQAGKHVFVEKPLAMNRTELASIQEAWSQTQGQQLMVGFNRRFSPLALRMHQLLTGRSQPISAVYTVNAGIIPPENWTQDPRVGGGRIIGEGCHFIDLISYLIGFRLVGLEARMMGATPGVVIRQDKMTILLEYADGSTGAVHYLANGSKNFPKERVEVFSEGRVLVMDNFRMLRGYGWKGLKKMSLPRQDKGHAAEVAAFIDRVTQGGESLIPWDSLAETTLATFTAVERAEQPARPPDP
jgi:predicted dehydrogenase/threonine dehydrogenase-like Zn-dependent dehydrogenase